MYGLRIYVECWNIILRIYLAVDSVLYRAIIITKTGTSILSRASIRVRNTSFTYSLELCETRFYWMVF